MHHSYVYAINGFQADMTQEQANELRLRDDVVLVEEDQMFNLTTDATGDFLGLTDPAGPYSRGYDGEGVVVGVIDSGVWPEHPSFADDGSYDPLPDFADVPCDFGNEDYNPEDEPFTCNNKVRMILSWADSTSSHYL